MIKVASQIHGEKTHHSIGDADAGTIKPNGKIWVGPVLGQIPNRPKI